MKIPSEASQIDQWKSIMFLYDSALKEINTKIEILTSLYRSTTTIPLSM